MQTPLHDWHVAHQGRMVDFAGWDMPVQYTTIVAEHQAVRTTAGLFDISHMGRIRFDGPDACRFLDYLLTNDVTQLTPGKIRYALATNSSGGVLDDVLVYCFEDHYLLVVNASNREKILSWLGEHAAGFSVEWEDLTMSQAMVAIQGPQSGAILQSVVSDAPVDIPYYTGTQTTIDGTPALLSRTGYTGEDGYEVILPAEHVAKFWQTLADHSGTTACGLGCRDTLRLEAAMPLYGHELDETIDPLTAGLQFAVRLKAGDFIGREALLKLRAGGLRRQRVGVQLDGKRIAREGALVLHGDAEIGQVTSGTFSPTLQVPIGMAYVDVEHTEPGTAVSVDIRGKRAAATVVPLPFYRRPE